jgi:hypothetical protein
MCGDSMLSLNITGGNAPYTVSLNDRGTSTRLVNLHVKNRFDFSGYLVMNKLYILMLMDVKGYFTPIREPVTLNPKAAVNKPEKTTVKLTPVTITVAAGNALVDLDYSLDGSSRSKQYGSIT